MKVADLLRRRHRAPLKAHNKLGDINFRGNHIGVFVMNGFDMGLGDGHDTPSSIEGSQANPF